MIRASALLAALLGVALSVVFARSDAPREHETEAETSTDAQSASLLLEPKIEFHARDVSVADALGQLRRALRKSIVVAGDVKQRYSGDLCDVTADEAVRAICRSVGLSAREDGSTVYVGAPEIESRTFHFSAIRVEEMAALVQGALSSKGSLVTSDAGTSGTPSNQGTITVFDYARNLSAVSELVRAFDVRPNETEREGGTALAASSASSANALASRSSDTTARGSSRSVSKTSSNANAQSASTSPIGASGSSASKSWMEASKSSTEASKSSTDASRSSMEASRSSTDAGTSSTTANTGSTTPNTTPTTANTGSMIANAIGANTGSTGASTSKTNSISPVGPAPLPSDIPRDAERLSRIYAEIARERLEHREPDAALLFLDAARALDARDTALESVRRRAARALIATSSAAPIDAAIQSRALDANKAARAKENGR